MEADLDNDGKISFEEFTKMVENTDVSMSMTLGELIVREEVRTELLTVGIQIRSKSDGPRWALHVSMSKQHHDVNDYPRSTFSSSWERLIDGRGTIRDMISD
jgi:hypothetical protein